MQTIRIDGGVKTVRDEDKIKDLLAIINPHTKLRSLEIKRIDSYRDLIRGRRSQLVKKDIEDGIKNGDNVIVSLTSGYRVIGLDLDQLAKKYEIMRLADLNVNVKEQSKVVEDYCCMPESLFQSDDIARYIAQNRNTRLDNNIGLSDFCMAVVKSMEVDSFMDDTMQQFVLLTNCLVSAILGNVQAQLILSDILLSYGKGDSKYASSLFWCNKAARAGYDKAKEKLDWKVKYDVEPIKALSGLVNKDYDRYRMIAECHNEDEYYLRGLYYERKQTPDYEKAFACYKRASEDGNVHAKEKLDISLLDRETGEDAYSKMHICSFLNDPEVDYKLAMAYLQGNGTAISYADANKYFVKSASNGNEKSKKMLDWKDAEGISSKLHLKKIQLAHNRGDVEASAYLAHCYYEGLGTEKSLQKAMEIYDSVKDRLQPKDCFDYATILRSLSVEEKYEQYYPLYRSAAECGYEPAKKLFDLTFQESLSADELFFRRFLNQKDAGPDNLYRIAQAYKNGSGIERNDERYREYLVMAAESDYVEAQFELATITKDPIERKEWLIRAATKGHLRSLISLPQKDAFASCLKAANAGYQNVYYQLAYYYETGYGTSVSFKKSLEWYKKASECGDTKASERLDITVKDPDPTGQYRKYRLAELNGYNVYAELSVCFRDGIGIEKDLALYEKCLRKSAESGNMISQVELASNLESIGKYHDALNWYRRASELGDALSKQRIDLDHLSSLSEKEQFSNLMLFSEENDPQVLYYIGKYKELGRGTEKDISKALSFIERSADQGYIDAIKWMGGYCERIHGGNYTYTDAIKWYQRAADNDDAGASELLDWSKYEELSDEDKFRKCRLFSESDDETKILQLAICYAKGIGTKVDEKEAFEYYNKCKGLNDPDALFWMGAYCEKTSGNGHTYTEAIELYTLASVAGNKQAIELLDWSSYQNLTDSEKYRKCILFSESNDPDCLFNLGYCYHIGVGTAKNLVLAKEYYKKSSELGNYNARFKLGLLIEDEGDYKSAYKIFKECSRYGLEEAIKHISLDDLDSYSEEEQLKKCMLHSDEKNAEVQFRLGGFYEKGIVVPKDYKKAAQCYKKAINLNHEDAFRHYDLSRLDTPGITDQDKYDLLMLHEMDKDSFVYYNIAQLYEKGTIPNSSEKVIFEYYKKAADLDHIDSCYRCGSMILDRKGTDIPISEAESYLQKALKNGMMEARPKLGRYYYTVFPPKYDEAAKLYRLSADSGDVEGQYMVGYMFEKGIGFPLFYSESVKWYMMAAKQGSFEAQFRLALLYQSGYGMIQSPDEAEAIMVNLKQKDSKRLLSLLDQEVKNGNESAREFWWIVGK